MKKTNLIEKPLFSTVSVVGLTFFLSPLGIAAPKLSARAIMEKNEAVRQISDLTSRATLVTSGGNSPERKKTFTWWRKLKNDGVHFSTFTRFHEPAEVRGQGILFLENESGDNDIQMYLPTYKKVRRVESQQQSGSFMGSEFSYSDIATPHVDDYEYSLLREEKCPTPESAKLACFVIESTPAKESVRERTGYSKVRTWIRSDQFMHVQIEYQNAEGAVFKRLIATDLKEVDLVKHRWMALNVRMENLSSGRSTELKFAEVKANQGIQDSIFTVQNLKKE